MPSVAFDINPYNYPDHLVSDGQAIISGQLKLWFDQLDSSFKKFASQYKLQEFEFPSFIDAKNCIKMDYLHSFPQHATFAVGLADTKENLDSFVASGAFDESGNIQPTKLAPVTKLLTPATCYHCYIALQNTAFDQPFYATARCQCFRREKQYTPFERQWQFNMRELICVGTYEETLSFTEAMKLQVESFIDKLGVRAEWKTAEDPFFNPETNPKALMQRIQPNKTELIYNDHLAVCSINVHRNYFGEIFNIKRDGDPAYTACVAFGLERWLAVMVQNGKSCSETLHKITAGKG